MMTFWLILTLTVPGHAPETLSVGVMRDDRTCQVAGAGMKYILEAANEGAVIAWTCTPTGEVA